MNHSQFYQISQDLLNNMPLWYLLNMTLGVLYWVKKRPSLYIAIPVVAGLGLLVHTVALGLRWSDGGLYRPPWTNLYESLVYFSWGMALITWGAELKFKTRSIGAFGYGVVFIGMVLAYFTPQKLINPLVPALQSWWILSHSFLAAFAYSGLLVASIFSFLYLVKDGLPARAFGLGSAFLGLTSLLMMGGTDLILDNSYQLNEMIRLAGQWTKNPIPDSNPQAYFQVALTGVPWLLWAGVGFYAAATVAYGLWNNPTQVILSWGRRLLGLGVLVHVAAVSLIFYFIAREHNLTFGSNPYHFGFVILAVLLQVFLLIVSYFPDGIAAKLPDADKLQSWAYSMTLFGFPFMTLILITGAIWAHEAWGRYWGWDPKETTAFVTWLIYAIYLHAYHLRGWRGRKAALISVVGFFSVLFTYLGANLVLSGLHSYGAQ